MPPPTILTTVTVDGKAVKEAVIDQVAKELCSSLRQQVSGSSFDMTDEAMKQALASPHCDPAESHCEPSHLCQNS